MFHFLKGNGSPTLASSYVILFSVVSSPVQYHRKENEIKRGIQWENHLYAWTLVILLAKSIWFALTEYLNLDILGRFR